MRKSNTNDGLKVQAVAGTYVVMLGLDLPRNKCNGLLGFSIHRFDHTENEAYYLKGMKAFAETDPGFPPGSLYSTREHPIQSFQWADYSAKPGYTYTYTVTALRGTPDHLVPIAQCEVKITTESPETGDQDIYFNRGTAASQEYVRRFGDKRPEDVIPPERAFEWLSRGIYEALVEYVNSCVPGGHSLRFAAYEFNYEPFLRILKAAKNQGVDIKIVYDGRKSPPKAGNETAIITCGLTGNCKPRTEGKSYISHNKFIVKLEHNNPVSVWTGGMNFSDGGIFGHSNVAHVIENKSVAAKYLEYWELLHNDPKMAAERTRVEAITPLPALPLQNEVTCVFSPRKGLDALELYKSLAMDAHDSLFMTFAFGINKVFKDVYRNSTAPLRFALLDKATRPMKAGPGKKAEEQDIQNLRNMTENIFAIGSFVGTNQFDGWVKETLTGLNTNVRYIHNKFMLVDPLSNDPLVIAGSANFSDASVQKNDENMVLVRGNTRVADIYLGEFMRLFSHHSFRESLQWRNSNDPLKSLRTDNWWEDYYGETSRSKRRKYFAGAV